MRNQQRTLRAAALLLAFVVTTAAAQQVQPSPDERAVDGSRREADGDVADTRRDVEDELRAAREQMQDAAREVARLSSELASPFVDGIARNFRFAGQRAMLGIGIEDTERGVRVASVSPSGPAAAAGVVLGDTIVAIDGADLVDTRVAGGARQSPSEVLLAQMANVDAGDEVTLSVLNESGAERDVEIEARDSWPRAMLGLPKLPGGGYSYSLPNPANWLFRSNPWGSLELVTLTPALGKYFGTDKGLLVVRGPEDGTLSLRDGDVILDIGGRAPTTPEHALRILGSFDSGEPLKITVMREQRRQTLDIVIPAERNG